MQKHSNEQIEKSIKEQLSHIYADIDQEGLFSEDDAAGIIILFYQHYRKRFREDHPMMSDDTMKDIITRLPIIKHKSKQIDTTPSDYIHLIDLYFNADMKKCDYHLPHFMTDSVRFFRYQEYQSEQGELDKLEKPEENEENGRKDVIEVPELKSCPYCGGNAHSWKGYKEEVDGCAAWIQCDDCGAQTYPIRYTGVFENGEPDWNDESFRKAACDWNRRAADREVIG